MCTLFSHIRVFCVVFITQTAITNNVRINEHRHPNIEAKTRIELRSLQLQAFLYDVIRLSAPVINEETLYYLYKPNGDVMSLDLHPPKHESNRYNGETPTIWAKFLKEINPIITQSNNYDVFSITDKGIGKDNDAFVTKVKNLEDNEYMIGPLSLEDHGNWVLSVFTKDLDGRWIELFQVISVTITEYLPLTPIKPKLKHGDTFNLSFSLPITNLESCELVAPRTTFDRLFNRSRVDINNCGFSVPHITEKDKGLWKIIGVGKIVYEGEVYLNVEKSQIKSTSIYLLIVLIVCGRPR